MLHDQISKSLADLKGFASSEPRTVVWAAPDAARIAADLTAVDTLSCALRELRVVAEGDRAGSLPACRAWAEAVCAKVTYLLERLGPYETDAAAQTHLVRSTPPGDEPQQVAYYEWRFEIPGVATLRRYAQGKASDRRQQIDLLLTHDVLQRLARDVVEAIPASGECRMTKSE